METSSLKTNTMSETLVVIWSDIGDIIIFIAILTLLYSFMVGIVRFLKNRNINFPIITPIFIAIIDIFTKKVTKTYKDGEELKDGTSEIISSIKEEIKKESKNEA